MPHSALDDLEYSDQKVATTQDHVHHNKGTDLLPQPGKPLVQPLALHNAGSTMNTTTVVDGQGMWRSWTRVFARPESACLDLLDNCFDAALAPNFHGKVVMEEFVIHPSEHDTLDSDEELSTQDGGSSSRSSSSSSTRKHNPVSALLIQNNCHGPTKALQDALTVYKSTKNSSSSSTRPDDHHPHNDNTNDTTTTTTTNNNNNNNSQKHAIGENGVGLKQGCATLSDCSIVLTRNQDVVEMGLIAKALQSNQGVYLPSFSFSVSQASSQIEKWLHKHVAVRHCLQQAMMGDGVLGVSPLVTTVRDTLVTLVHRMFRGAWQDEEHVFLLVLWNLHSHVETSRPQSQLRHVLLLCDENDPNKQKQQQHRPVKAFLNNLRTLLPEYYINLPSFDFVMDGERIHFDFWSRRLVELTRFEVHVPLQDAFENLPETNWDQPDGNHKYKLNIYCGFDAQRVHHGVLSGQGASTCYMYIYSRAAGRLITKEVDARHMLGLSSSGVDYTQGLTILVGDISGRLPLTPTKDGIAWSEQSYGDVHRRNLWAWVGAVAQVFWTHHKNVCKLKKNGNATKEMLKKVMLFYAQQQMAETSSLNQDPHLANLEDAQLSTFAGIHWTRTQNAHSTFWRIRRNAAKPCKVSMGTDTLYRITTNIVLQVLKEETEAKLKNDGKKSGTKRKKTTAMGGMAAVAARAASVRDENSSAPEGNVLDEPLDWKGRKYDLQNVEGQDVERVSRDILAYLRGLDKFDWFEQPVVETLPHLKERYLGVIAKPMDFRTIEQQRMHQYTSIEELQDDLVLVFENCIKYNGPNSSYGIVAKKMLHALDDAWECVLTGKRCRKKKCDWDEIVQQYDEALEVTKTAQSGKSRTISRSELQKQLKAERVRIQALEKKVAERDRYISELESLLPARGNNSSHRRRGRGDGQCTPVTVPSDLMVGLAPPHQTTIKTEDGCQICGQTDQDPDLVLLCDKCDKEYHMYCLSPPLFTVPPGNWYCDTCRTEELESTSSDDDDDDDDVVQKERDDHRTNSVQPQRTVSWYDI